MTLKKEKEYTGKNLIFLLSQPRSGSTLLQKMLNCNSEIHSTSEPWILLNGIYNLKENGLIAEYNHQIALIAQKEFVESLPNKSKDYSKSLRLMYAYLYNQALLGRPEQFFLDKTPRYYSIIPEMFNLFPDAKYIYLFRNPMSVLNSIVDTWIKTKIPILSYYGFEKDLLEAPNCLISGFEKTQSNSVKVKYEDIVLNPEKELKKICLYIGIDYELNMINYGESQDKKWILGDQINVYKHKKPIMNSLDKWVQALDNSQKWRLMNGYLKEIGEDSLGKMGYSYKSIKQILDDNAPVFINRMLTISFDFSVSKTIGNFFKILNKIKMIIKNI